jgi:hypothetical protein
MTSYLHLRSLNSEALEAKVLRFRGVVYLECNTLKRQQYGGGLWHGKAGSTVVDGDVPFLGWPELARTFRSHPVP